MRTIIFSGVGPLEFRELANELRAPRLIQDVPEENHALVGHQVDCLAQHAAQVIMAAEALHHAVEDHDIEVALAGPADFVRRQMLDAHLR